MSEAAPAAPSGNDGSDSALGRLVGVFVSPVRTFAAIARKPTWLLPVAISAGLSLPVSELILSKTDWRAVVTSQVAKAERHLSEAQVDQAVEQAQRISWLWDVIAVAAPIVVLFIIAAVLWGACNAFGWEVRFRQSLGITSHAFLPGVLTALGLMAALWNRATVDPQKIGDVLPTNLGHFAAGRVDAVTHGLLASIDLFSFWTMALLVLGLSAAARASRGRVAALVVTLWALYVLGKAGATALMG
jgi:hypothetical protein